MSSDELTHLDAQGRARMVDVGSKPSTERTAVARSAISMLPETLDLIEAGQLKKGDVFAVARIAGIMAAKRTAELIPLCHPLPLTQVEVDLVPHRDRLGTRVVVTSRVKTCDRTGVEMEALVAVSIAALTIYDMCKAVDRGMTVGDTYVVEKRGGKSGTFVHPGR